MTKVDYEHNGTNKNIVDCFKLREICKQCKHWSSQCDSFLSPNIRSLKSLIKWTKIVPNLQSMSLIDQTWPISLSYLRFLCIRNVEDMRSMQPSNVTSWNCPLLEHLEIFCIVTERDVKEIAGKFPKLTHLYVTMDSVTCLKISDFPNLKTLSLSVYRNDEFKNTIQIFDIPNLVELFCNGTIGLLEMKMVPNLRKISTMNGFYMIRDFSR
jgi:hypothetical protein